MSNDRQKVKTFLKADAEFAATYDNGRPGYGQEPFTFILNTALQFGDWAGLKPVSIANIGIGTGLDTEPLVQALLAPDDKIRKLTIYGIEPSEQFRAAAASKPVLQDAAQRSKLQITDGSFTKTGLEDKSVNIQISAQALHWGTRGSNLQGYLKETARTLKADSSVFAIYNAPVAASINGTVVPSFTSELNALLAELAPDAYYQALASGNVAKLMAERNVGFALQTLADTGNGQMVYKSFDNPTPYKDLDTIKAYVFSNGFVQAAIQEYPAREDTIKNELAALFDQYGQGPSAELEGGGVTYGNKTIVLGATRLKLPDNAFG